MNIPPREALKILFLVKLNTWNAVLFFWLIYQHMHRSCVFRYKGCIRPYRATLQNPFPYDVFDGISV